MRIILLLTTILLIYGCNYRLNYENNVIHQYNAIIEPYFCPYENCSLPFLETINGTNKSVYCAFFDLDYKPLIEILENLSIHGKDVKLVIDFDNKKPLINSTLDIVFDTKRSYMHNKFCIIDNVTVVTGSLNPTRNGFELNNNNYIIINSQEISNVYQKEFFELYNGIFSGGDKSSNNYFENNDTSIEIFFCPEDCDKGTDMIIEIINNANSSIDFMTFSFTHTRIANALVKKQNQNISIRGIFESTGTGSQYSKYKLFSYQGIFVRKDSNKGAMHHKVFIIDNNTIITGSFNPSANAENENDENIIIIKNVKTTKSYLDEFERVWNTTRK